VFSYEPTSSKYGNSFKLTVEREDGEVEVWSNKYINDYLTSIKPTQKFKIEVTNGRVTINGWSKKIILK
jgi:hypothetical protein